MLGESLIFAVIVGILWYLFLAKNIFGLGVNVNSKKDVLRSSITTAVIAGIIYYIIGLVW